MSRGVDKMTEDWERNTQAMGVVNILKLAWVAVLAALVAFALVGLYLDLFPRVEALILIIAAIVVGVADLFYLPVFKRKLERISRKRMRTFPLGREEAARRLEEELGRMVTSKEEVMEGVVYTVTHGSAEAEVALWPDGEGTLVSITPPEEEWGVQGLLRRVEEALGAP